MVKNGFTLIELMVALTILSLLMLTASYSYSQFTTRWDTVLDDFYEVNQENRGLEILRKVLAGIHGYVILKENYPTLFFVGKQESILAITHSGILDANASEIFRLSFVRNENEKCHLIYQAVSSNDILLLSSEQEILFDREIVLLKELDECSFSFYGWKSSEDKSPESQIEPKWYDNFSGLDYQLLPKNISVNISTSSGQLAYVTKLDERAELLMSAYFDE